MRLVSCLLVVSVLFVGACTGGGHRFTVIGNIKNSPDATNVLLTTLGADDKIVVVDSTHIDDKGHFELKAESATPGVYQLIFGQGAKYILLSLDKGNVKVNADWADMRNYSVEGSAASVHLKGFMQRLTGFVDSLQNMDYARKALSAQGGNDSIIKIVIQDEANTQQHLTHFIEHYADTSSFLHNSVYAARLLNAPVEYPYLQGFYNSLPRRFPNNAPEVKEYVDRFRRVSPPQEAKNDQQVPGPKVGTMAPEITLPTADGKVVTLSSFKGKYVLVDFWASWCPPCRAENPKVVEAFNKYQGRGFTILGVSLDQEKSDWLEAIKKDKLTWTHISDLKRWESVAARDYSVESIPANFLVDKDGMIIGRDLHGGELEAKLAEVLK